MHGFCSKHCFGGRWPEGFRDMCFQPCIEKCWRKGEAPDLGATQEAPAAAAAVQVVSVQRIKAQPAARCGQLAYLRQQAAHRLLQTRNQSRLLGARMHAGRPPPPANAQ